MYDDIINNEPDYSLLKNVSEAAVQFIQIALEKNPNNRASIDLMLEHDWIKNNLNKKKLSNEKQLDLSANLHNFAKTN